MASALKLSGLTFGRLTALEPAGTSTSGHVRWLCLCLCGRSTVTMGSYLLSGHCKSCGCLRKEVLAQHNETAKKTVDAKRATARDRWHRMTDEQVRQRNAQIRQRRRNNLALHLAREQRDSRAKVHKLSDGYVRLLVRLTVQSITGTRPKDIPGPLVEAKRAHLKVKRLVKEQQ